MFAKLEGLEERYESLTEKLASPDITSQPALFRELSKEHAELTPLLEAWRELRQVDAEIVDSKKLLEEDDADMVVMAREELRRLEEQKSAVEDRLRRMLLPKDPNDAKNVILEIRAGTGGEEATLFAADLYRMYTRYAETQRWRIDLLSQSVSASGGFKEIISLIEGQGAYSRLKFESGVHRVQRVPETESQGRIHTSAATVAVLPEADEIEVQIDDKDLRIDVFRSSGPGGQSVNTTDSAVRVTHIPSGLVVSCQDEKSQHKNKAKALKILQARLLERMQEEAAAETSATRRAMVGTGDRSERIRTYNFPQGRLTDHRVEGLTLYKLEAIMNGDLGGVIDALATHSEAEALKAQDSDGAL